MRIEMVALADQKTVQEEEVWKILEQHMENWKPTERKMKPSLKQLGSCSRTATPRGKSGTRLGQFLASGQRAWVVQRHRRNVQKIGWPICKALNDGVDTKEESLNESSGQKHRHQSEKSFFWSLC